MDRRYRSKLNIGALVVVLFGGSGLVGCGDDGTTNPGTSSTTTSSSSGGGNGGGGQGGNNQGGQGGAAACVDGATQECYSADPTTAGVGECKKGTQTCANGNWGACSGEVTPAASESCDGLDNDCNGQVDEGDPGGGGVCMTGQPGVCGPGKEACLNGMIVCNADVMPSNEICDGLDNDCNGQSDENNPGGGGACMTGQMGVCGNGSEQCQNGALVCVGTTMASNEICDGLDNDCNGQVDEGNPGGGMACMTGLLGVCGPGTVTCASAQLLCLPNTSPAPMDICGNMLDDDCDGMLDDGCAVCGNGVVEAGEQCDDGNTNDYDGCGAACMNEPCAHGICVQGPALDSACDPCVTQLCAQDAFCCSNTWDGICIDEVGTICGLTCASTCGNSLVEAGEQCDDGNTAAGDGCSDTCQNEGCAHDKCDTGGALDPACDPCVAQICAADAFCCNNTWDSQCVGEVASVCGLTCPVCGDGIVDAGEQCDDGNNTSGDGCSATCSLEPVCGDGAQDQSEQCDDGNVLNGDGCSNYCTLEGCAHDICETGAALTMGCNTCVDQICAADAFCCNNSWDNQCLGEVETICGIVCGAGPVCGDGVMNGIEECDDGNTADGDGCSANCTLEPVCGDGIMEGSEQCDDGNVIDGDGCSASCQLEVCAHDKCVIGTALNPAYCDPCVAQICAVDAFCCSTSWDGQCVGEVASICGMACPVCGDGTLDAGEQCDDGNTTDGDGCSSACTLEDVCGDGTLGSSEQCDDGNVVDGDGCSNYCTLEGCAHDICVEGSALTQGCNACADSICAADPYCCNTDWDATCVGEVSSVCGLECGPGAVCGNGVLQAPEQCDDGNTANGDGCSSTCTFQAVCGDGTTDASEQCDDGNTAAGDGCSNYCTLEGCAHDICVSGTALTMGCNTCADTVCAADPYCCNTSWDGQCVGEVATECGILTCP